MTHESTVGTAGGAGGRMPEPRDVPRPWLESYPPGVPTTYDYPAVPLTRLLDDAAQDFPEVAATDFLGARTTYRELQDSADRLAAGLAGLGVGPGDRVALLLPDCPQHVVVLFAIWRLGAVATEHDPTVGEARLERELREAGCRVVVCLEGVYPALSRLKGRLPTVRHVVSTRLTEALPPARRLLAAWRGRRDGTRHRIPAREGVLRLTALVRRSAPLVTPPRSDGADGVAAILYAGSSTGAGAVLTHANLVASAFQVRLWLPDFQAGREVVLAGASLSHGFGAAACALQTVLSAGTLLLLPRLDAALVRRVVARRKPTVLVGEPPLFAALASGSDREQDLPWVRVCLSGGELSEPVARGIERRTGGKLREGWGCEGTPLTHVNPVYGRAKTGTVGLPLPDTVCAVVDPAAPSRRLGPDRTGEVLVAGPQVPRERWSRPGETAAALPGGWVRSGVLGRMDADGYLTVLGPVRHRS